MEKNIKNIKKFIEKDITNVEIMILLFNIESNIKDLNNLILEENKLNAYRNNINSWTFFNISIIVPLMIGAFTLRINLLYFISLMVYGAAIIQMAYFNSKYKEMIEDYNKKRKNFLEGLEISWQIKKPYIDKITGMIEKYIKYNKNIKNNNH